MSALIPEAKEEVDPISDLLPLLFILPLANPLQENLHQINNTSSRDGNNRLMDPAMTEDLTVHIGDR
jgi:hypothetical protein